MTRRRLLASAVAICALLVASFGSPTGVPRAAASPNAATHAIPVTMFAGEPYPWTYTNLNKDWFTKYVEKRFGLKFQFTLVPSADVASKQALVLASGKYPDIFWQGSFTPENVLQYGSQGILKPLNQLIKKYAPNVLHAINTNPELKQAVTTPSGKIYSLPEYSYCYHCTWDGGLTGIDLEDLNKYHLSMPRTTQQFEHVLEVFKSHGLVPLTGNEGSDPTIFLMNAFIPYSGPGAPNAYLDVTNSNKVIFAADQPQWKEGLEYIHQLYAKGLFSKTVFTQPLDTVNGLVQQNKVGVVCCGDSDWTGGHYPDWIGVPALKGPSGAQFSSAVPNGGVYGLRFAITKAATKTQAVRIMKLINFLYTTLGTQLQVFGPEGKYWHPAKKGETGMSPKQAKWTSDWNAPYDETGKPPNVAWVDWGPIGYSEYWTNVANSLPAPFTKGGGGLQAWFQLIEEVDYAGKQPAKTYPPTVWVPASDSQSYATEETNIDNYVEQWTAEFATGEKSIQGDWSQYLAGLKNLGLTAFMKTSQKVMGQPVNTRVPLYSRSASNVRYLVRKGPVPALVQKYLIESGVPASDFKK